MKRLILIFYLGSISLPSHAQTWNEWWKQKDTQKKYLAEQLIALKAYGAVLKEGYEVASKGLGLVHTIQNGDYTQHETYFSSFSSINPQIKNHPKAEKTIALYSKTRQLTLQIPNRLFAENRFTASEENIIRHVLQSIYKDCDQMLLDLQTLLRKDQLNLSDSERISQLSQIHAGMQEAHSYTIWFYQNCHNLSLSRQNESRAIEHQKSVFLPSID
ncbi:hypothetical protein SAMN04489724_3074 [Algoriphagus locisalis]|uniref:Uncharacterized protein n=1 Tax=Algoriphagus locisalis TaxID=305507 RepID=A0A1I7CCX8_9BACT|nr:hypothetical protein [Algoriphagus locisalis]SFT97281.1 hypothetical protein SAMN04489724_3074 [Algoriphagus locisalis]